MGRRADVPWEPEDEKPPAADCRKIIPHGKSPSAPTAPPTSTAPSPASQPIYHLVHRLFERLDQMERRNQWRYERSKRRSKQRYEHLKLMIRSGYANIPSESDTPSEPSEEEADEQEEDAQAEDQHQESQHDEPQLEQSAESQAPIQAEPQAPTLPEPTEPAATHPSGGDDPSHLPTINEQPNEPRPEVGGENVESVVCSSTDSAPSTVETDEENGKDDPNEEMHESISKIRNAIRYVRASPSRKNKFKNFIKKARIQDKCTVQLDVPTR
nr:transcription factor TBF1-like [Arachis hypogaea]